MWVFYHLMGLMAQGSINYLKHFTFMPGAPLVDVLAGAARSRSISHLSRVMSLSLRLFGNIFGEEMVVVIIASIVPFVAPLPMMVLGLVTGTLQAFIFVMLTIIYLAAAVHTDHEHEEHEHEAGRARGGLAADRRTHCGTSRTTPGRHHPAGVTRRGHRPPARGSPVPRVRRVTRS